MWMKLEAKSLNFLLYSGGIEQPVILHRGAFDNPYSYFLMQMSEGLTGRVSRNYWN